MRIPVMTVTLVIIVSIGVEAETARFPRHPSPSPDGSHVAFSWQGDIWIAESTGGVTRRMTVHPGADRFPVWSPDGSLIAFASLRHGQYDIYLLSVDGNEPPRRLTYASSYDYPCDFSKNGELVIFSSHRNESVRSLPGLYAIPITGGTPYLYQDVLGRQMSFSPDGSSRVFVRGRTLWTRSGYQGSANRDIWLWSEKSGYSQITDFPGDDDCPGWIDDSRIMYLSSQSGRKNLYIRDLETHAVEQITSYSEYDARFPRVSADGSLIAYEYYDQILLYAPETGSSNDLSINVPMDYIAHPVQYVCTSQDASEIAVQPDGSCIAFIVKGDIFIVELLEKDELEYTEPRTRRLTFTSAQEKDLSWSSTGDELVFSSDRNGNQDLYILTTAEREKEWIDAERFIEKIIVGSELDEYSARFSPDGNLLAYIRNRGDIVIRNRSNNQEHLLTQSWLPPEFRWSPDSRYLAYSAHDENYNQDIWIARVDASEQYNLSRHPDTDQYPRWSPDGKRIIWASKRHNDTFDIWGVWLTREDHERTNRSWFEYWHSSALEEKPDGNESAVVSIDFDGLWDRSTFITRLPGNETHPEFIKDGSSIAFSADERDEHDLFSIRWDGSELNRLTTGNLNPRQICTSITSSSILFLTNSEMIRKISMDSDDLSSIDFDACYSAETASEHNWVFDQVWRLLNKWYYDPTFHGISWDDQFARYKDLARHASSEPDFEDAIDLMLGEMNSSHMNYRSPQSGDELQAGWLGIHFARSDDDRGVPVLDVIPDTPAARLDVNIEAGDRIISVDGIPLDPHSNLFKQLIGKTGKDVRIEVVNSAHDIRSVVLTPVARRDINRALYDQWVENRQNMTDEQTDGFLGYVHIQSMSENSFEQFERALYTAGNGRKGLIIDVRSNGGGWITDHLLASLMVERHSYTRPRGYTDSTRAYPQVRLPFAAWTKPAVVLCNEESFSNAEIFAHAFKTLERGLLLGTPTFGGVISTGTIQLMNGGSIRIPRRGWFNAVSGEDLENNGARPHEIVLQPPEEDCSMTQDTQLEYAIERFLETIEEDPRFENW